jgi:ketosteroid isomerase-like protein
MEKLYMILPLALILCFIVGCQSKEAMAELEEFRTQATLEEQNKEIVRHYLEEIDKGNIDIMDEIISDDCQIYFPGSLEPLSCEEMKQQRVAPFHDKYENITHRIEDMIAEGDKVLARTVHIANSKVDKQKTFMIGGLLLYRIRDGKIAEYWIQEDLLWSMKQLGMELKPKENEN